MKTILLRTLFCLLALNSFGQSDTDKLHSRFLHYLKMEKVDSIYNSFLEVKENDIGYEKALLYRNQNGWLLNKTEQLKKDFVAILKLPSHSHQMAYVRIFRPQKSPPSEWNRFLELSIELEKSFDPKSTEYRELLGIKTMLELITRNNEALLLDLPKLLERLDKNSKAYSSSLWQYGTLLIRNGNKKEALKVYEEGANLGPDTKFLKSLMRLYSENKDFKKVLKYKEKILADSSGVLLYYLGEAYSEKGENETALEYFTRFTSEFEYSEHEPDVAISYENTVYHLTEIQLEKLGDFFLELDKKQSCKFYEYAKRIIQNSNEERFFKKQLMAIKDENQKKAFIEKHETHKKEQVKVLTRISKKAESCK
jgi:tetratricopeptide (TPR) repeat protein